jgi:hypothetical protein
MGCVIVFVFFFSTSQSDWGTQKLKTWFSNQKTKDKGRKIEPFRVWLGRLANLSGPPRHTRLPWVAWQHPQHGDALRTLYRQKYHVNADEEDGEGEKELEEEDKGEDEDERDTITAGALNRKYAFTKEYLATLSTEEREELVELRDKDFEDRQAAHKRLLMGEDLCSSEELAE